MTGFLELFRQGYDTAQISAMTGEPEHVVYNMMHREKLGEAEQAKLAEKLESFRRKYRRSYAGKEWA